MFRNDSPWRLRLEAWLRRVSQRAGPLALSAAGAAILLAMNQARADLKAAALSGRSELEWLDAALDESDEAYTESLSMRDLKARDVERFKKGLSRLAQSRRSIYEGGLQLQEEKRLLEKQWEIMTTYLMVDEAEGKIRLMRGEQALETYPLGTSPAKAYGGELQPPAPLAQIVSKERFAHPERGKYEEVNGQLQWEPPQVGTSVRANALGEYVMFTRSSLILHGPPRRRQEHEAFPHYCLELSLRVAQRLYSGSFIGTKIVFKPAPRIERPPASAEAPPVPQPFDDAGAPGPGR